ncbi:MAG TPA: PEP/pyruvate-binding domain-containing protein [Solirubrobacteraceae bacterium]|nr:PEP/pyruvate-binding domain-containing protein [Solirubrobacteraceae bacterium]
MKAVVSLEEAREVGHYGSKAVGLGDAARGGLPIPPGFALSADIVEAVAEGEERSIAEVLQAVSSLSGPFAVRSSAVDEDGADASFAGQHMTLLNVPSTGELVSALKEIWWSANSDSAITYRQRVGLFTRPSIAVVVQSLLDPESAGVMFTRNPITGEDERLIEASWGLGEVVVAGRVIPDTYRVARSGEVLERTAGYKKVVVRSLPDGGTVEERVAPELVERLCLDDERLNALSHLAERCEAVYGPGRDIEWAMVGGQLYLLQCRAVTRGGGESASPAPTAPPVPGLPLETLKEIPLFAGLATEDLAKVRSLFKERRFAPGETVTKEGSGGAAFFLIDSGEASVTVGGKPRPGMTAGDFFGEIALIDGGERSATVTAVGELVCFGLTYWDFRPLVQENSAIAWALLQSLAQKLRAEQHG